MKKLFLVIVFILSIALTGCTLVVNGKEVVSNDGFSGGNTRAEKTEVKETAVDGQDKLNISNKVGKLDIKAWDGDSVKITATKKVRTSGSQKKANSMLNDIKIEIDKDSESINISVKYKTLFGWASNRSVEMEVLVPSKIKQIDGDTVSGEITASDLKDIEELDVSSISGRLNVENCSAKSYKIGTTSGKLSVNGLEGKGRVKSISGGIELQNIKGDTECRSTSGRISADGIEGRIDSETISGSVDFSDAYIKDSTRFHTISGSINVDAVKIDPEGKYNFSSISGSVNIGLPEDSQFNLEAKSLSGSINNSFEGTFDSGSHHVSGKVGNGGAEFIVKTTSGSVNINK